MAGQPRRAPRRGTRDYATLQLAARKSENKGEVLTKACFIITDYTSIKHLSLHERSPEECFPPENTFISHFNLLQSLILIDPNP